MLIAIIAISIIILIIIIIIVVVSSDGGHSFKSNGSFYNNNIDIDNTKAPKLDNINKSNDQQEFGIAGENRVANMLKRIQKNYKSYIFNDFTFKDDEDIQQI